MNNTCKFHESLNKFLLRSVLPCFILSAQIRFVILISPPHLSLIAWQVLIKQEIQRKSGYAIQVDEEHLRVQLDTIQSELNAPTQFKVSVKTLAVCMVKVLIFSCYAIIFIGFNCKATS